MEHQPPADPADVATTRDLDRLRRELRGDLSRELQRQTYAVVGALTAIIGIALIIVLIA